MFSSCLGLSDPFDPHHRLVSSPIHSPHLLVLRRVVLALYGCATVITSLVYDSVVFRQGNIWFSFFTHLSFIGLTAYFLTSAYHTSNYKPSSSTVYAYPLQRWPRALQALHMLLLCTTVTFPILVTVCYWVLLASPQTFASPYYTWSAISLHIFNTVFALLEITTTNIPPLPWAYLPLCILLLGGYLGMAYITHVTEGSYAYNFLDPQQQHGKLAGYIIGIAVAEVIIFILVRYTIVLRDKLFKFSLYHDQGDERGARREALDEWQDVEWDEGDRGDSAGSSGGGSPAKAMREAGLRSAA